MGGPIVSVLHLVASNDKNGIPRRLFVGLDQHGHIGVLTDEGLESYPAWVKQLRDRGVWEFQIHVSASVYRQTRQKFPSVPHTHTLDADQLPLMLRVKVS